MEMEMIKIKCELVAHHDGIFVIDFKIDKKCEIYSMMPYGSFLFLPMKNGVFVGENTYKVAGTEEYLLDVIDQKIKFYKEDSNIRQDMERITGRSVEMVGLSVRRAYKKIFAKFEGETPLWDSGYRREKQEPDWVLDIERREGQPRKCIENDTEIKIKCNNDGRDIDYRVLEKADDGSYRIQFKSVFCDVALYLPPGKKREDDDVLGKWYGCYEVFAPAKTFYERLLEASSIKSEHEKERDIAAFMDIYDEIFEGVENYALYKKHKNRTPVDFTDNSLRKFFYLFDRSNIKPSPINCEILSVIDDKYTVIFYLSHDIFLPKKNFHREKHFGVDTLTVTATPSEFYEFLINRTCENRPWFESDMSMSLGLYTEYTKLFGVVFDYMDELNLSKNVITYTLPNFADYIPESHLIE